MSRDCRLSPTHLDVDRFFVSSEIERMGHVGDLGIRRSDEVRTKLREAGGGLGDTCHQPRRAD